MNRSVKFSIVILIFLIIGACGFAGYTVFEKQKVEDAKSIVEEERDLAEEREQRKIKEVKQLKKEIEVIQTEKTQLESNYETAKQKSDQLKVKVDEITKDRDKWKNRLESITKERDQLTKKINTLQTEVSKTKSTLDRQKDIVRRFQQKAVTDQNLTATGPSQSPKVIQKTANNIKIPDNIPPASDEAYWASILQEKAALEIKITDMEESLAQSSIEIVEIKQQNEDLTIELDSLSTQSEELGQEIKYKSDMINNLSLELARSKNDKKFVADRLEKIQEENRVLRQDMKQLVSAKSSLQKSIVRLTQDKNKVEKELGSAESLIQSKIDEIWEIKDSLDRSFKDSNINSQQSNTVELPPIMVNAEKGAKVPFNVGATEPGFNGRVVSINEENNFVIVDLGESEGIKLGDDLSVYRDSRYIARLEIIQVRKDICAADIKDQWVSVRVGDIIR